MLWRQQSHGHDLPTQSQGWRNKESVSVCVPAHIQGGGRAQKVNFRVIPQVLFPPPPPPPAGNLTGPGPHRAGYTGWLARPRDLLISSRRITSRDHHPWLFHMGSENPTQWLCFCLSKHIQTERPSLKESIFSLYLLIPRTSNVHSA